MLPSSTPLLSAMHFARVLAARVEFRAGSGAHRAALAMTGGPLPPGVRPCRLTGEVARMTVPSGLPRVRSRVRPATLATLLAALLLVPLLVLFAQVWSNQSRALSDDRMNRAGLAYAGPLTDLVAVLARAQSAVVQGKEIDATALSSALGKMDEADRSYGADLRTTSLWTDARARIV